MLPHWTNTDVDKAIAESLRGFVPQNAFDAHAHVYSLTGAASKTCSIYHNGPGDGTIKLWRESVSNKTGPIELIGGIFTAIPVVGQEPNIGNDFLLEELAEEHASRGLVLITPEQKTTDIDKYLACTQIVGFKPYHLFSTKQPTWDSVPQDFIPEWAWEIANDRKLLIMLHLVRSGALADSGNQHYIRTMCEKYPSAKLNLAHCARGFHAPNTVNAIASLTGLQNVYFDMSGVCEAAPMVAILKAFGPTRLMWGTDFPVSEQRGRCVTIGDSFSWIAPTTVDPSVEGSPVCNSVLVGLESLRALKEAAETCFLNEEDLQGVFGDNALRMLGLKEESGNLTQELYTYAKSRIPGGAQLLSKRPEMFAPDRWPAYFKEARGCETWDMDGRHYYDMSLNSVGACLLGFGDPDVTNAVMRRVSLGSICSQNPPEEVELADLLCELHPWAEQARFARCGGEIGAVAVRIARATTDRSVVAICGYHGWQDWYLAANLGESDSLRGCWLPGLEPLGVPRELRGTAVTFQYEDLEAFEKIIREQGDRLAAVIMEPCRYQDPSPGFLESVRDGTHRAGALLIFDEITIGWRLHTGGSHLRFGVNPDLAIFAKALGNGFPIGAVIGTKQAMAGAHGSFISSTFWTESIGPVAACATVKKMQSMDVPGIVSRVGEKVTDSWKRWGVKHGLPVVAGDGYPSLAHFRFNHPLHEQMRTIYTILMLERGFLAGTSIYGTVAHTDEILAKYDAAIDDVFSVIGKALCENRVEKLLTTPVAHIGFRRLL